MPPQHQSSTKNVSFLNDNTPFFSTPEFYDFAKHLVHKGSLSSLFGFLLSSSGTNSAMMDTPYIGILYSNLKLTEEAKSILFQHQKKHYLSLWSTEIFTRILSTLARELHTDIDPSIPNLAPLFSSQLMSHFKKEKVCCIYRTQYLSDVQQILDQYFQNSQIKMPLIDANVIAKTHLDVLDDLLKYYSSRDDRRCCLLLTFFGANFEELSQSRPSDSLREILLCKQNVSPVSEFSINATEAKCRQAISSAIHDEVSQINTELEKTLAFVHVPSPWYCLIRKIKQLFHRFFSIPKLECLLDAFKQIDASYKASISFGDCSEFFSSLHDISSTFNSTGKKRTARLFLALKDIQRSYPIPTCSEYVSHVRNCESTYHPVNLNDVRVHSSNKLQRIKQKLCVYVKSMKNTVIQKRYIPSSDAQPTACSEKTTAQGSNVLTNPADVHASINDTSSSNISIASSNDNAAAHTKKHKKRTTTKKRSLFKSVHDILHRPSSRSLRNIYLKKSHKMHHTLSKSTKNISHTGKTHPLLNVPTKQYTSCSSIDDVLESQNLQPTQIPSTRTPESSDIPASLLSQELPNPLPGNTSKKTKFKLRWGFKSKKIAQPSANASHTEHKEISHNLVPKLNRDEKKAAPALQSETCSEQNMKPKKKKTFLKLIMRKKDTKKASTIAM
ncbi:hypothetical protein APHNP_1132 [Anaplasma phagocytophilum str. ApNP]|uniref:Uncharacterized protein n=2 Tax=Anaplasma phagocytophilum TaxID=948 RepID=A0A0F3NG41_ANAPH|nr:hypothetical protein APHNP_1132 [Anaplasma phagocytophilum str. ApNP]